MTDKKAYQLVNCSNRDGYPWMIRTSKKTQLAARGLRRCDARNSGWESVRDSWPDTNISSGPASHIRSSSDTPGSSCRTTHVSAWYDVRSWIPNISRIPDIRPYAVLSIFRCLFIRNATCTTQAYNNDSPTRPAPDSTD
ncbi:unnamed protein product [Callosobruchus maculatus]|uniref:Uncharacterized protein n=1 Tax=Callosobruchus maculatus TaxID=64391 RepID=A0A653C148_CALMS|nr:unnamed protein product [Callosobruchus maculatus]